jgi:hypothetical protein
MRIALSCLAISLLGCGVDVPTPDAPAINTDPGYQTLISTPWTLDANSEKYLCLRVTMTQDVWIKTIQPIAPVGTHHGVLMLAATPTVADGLTECSSMLTDPAIYASGVGTTSLDFPDGVGLHIQAGEQLFLNLHLFNASDSTLSGTSGIEYIAADPMSIVHEAASVLIGAANKASVPVGLGVTLKFECTPPADTTIFAVAPHMHLLGTHLNATYTPMGGAATTLADLDYSFDDQKFRTITPLVTSPKGKYDVTCTYDNESGSPVAFGESTTQEMCFAMTYVYPPPGASVCGTEIQ